MEALHTGGRLWQQPSFCQPLNECADVGQFADAIISVRIDNVVTSGTDTVDLSIRTLMEANDPTLVANGGYATEVWKLTTITSGTYQKKAIYLDASNTAPIERYLMWVLSVNGTGGPWRVTFSISVLLKRRA